MLLDLRDSTHCAVCLDDPHLAQYAAEAAIAPLYLRRC